MDYLAFVPALPFLAPIIDAVAHCIEAVGNCAHGIADLVRACRDRPTPANVSLPPCPSNELQLARPTLSGNPGPLTGSRTP
jgi:hypothetical protein